MDELKQRFPDDLAYDVFWDTTVFVTATIDEVVHTLVIAFVLVAIVVFLFLGKLRTTLIPLIAVPVSIIGTFAVMLLIGYSANTVSLLALVLAIGIVVDDAIVVIENVERVIEEEPELSIPEATKKAMARDHRADHRHHPGAAVGVRAGGLHSRHQRPAVPPVRRGGVDRDADLGGQCADAQPGAVRGAAEARRAARRGPMQLRAGRASTGCATAMSPIVRRLVRVAVFGVVAVAAVARRRRSALFRIDAAGLPAGGGPGRVLRRHAAARGRLAQPHRASWSRRSRTSSGRSPACRACCRSSASTSSTTSLSSNQRLLRRAAEALRGAHRPQPQTSTPSSRSLRPSSPPIQGAIVFPFNLPPILGLGSTGGFQYVLAGPAGPVARPTSPP